MNEDRYVPHRRLVEMLQKALTAGSFPGFLCEDIAILQHWATHMAEELEKESGDEQNADSETEAKATAPAN